jgi:hypothetical protein
MRRKASVLRNLCLPVQTISDQRSNKINLLLTLTLTLALALFFGAFCPVFLRKATVHYASETTPYPRFQGPAVRCFGHE